MATSRTSRVRSRSAARWFRDRVGAHPTSETSASAEAHQPKAVGVGVGLFVLVVLTTSTVAWVSIWWVPAYLSLMFVIFVTPKRGRQLIRVSKPGEVSIVGVVTELGHSLRGDRADERDHHHLASELSSGQVKDDSISALKDFRPAPASTELTKPRRGRSRMRKTPKVATESAFDSSSVVWIRVGPGKFVRADANTAAISQAQTDLIATGVDPVADLLTELPSVSLAPAEAQTEENPSHVPKTSSVDERIFATPADRVLVSITEEYGIAPSAFSPVPVIIRSVNGLAFGEPEQTVAPLADCGLTANLNAKASRDRENWRRPGLQGRTSANRVGRYSRRIASAVASGDRLYLRRRARQGQGRRSSVWASDRSNARVRQVARLAFGRIPHIQRALRPRSPPHR